MLSRTHTYLAHPFSLYFTRIQTHFLSFPINNIYFTYFLWEHSNILLYSKSYFFNKSTKSNESMPLIWTEDVVVDFLFRLKTNPYILILSLFISVIFCCGLRFNGAILLKFERDLYFRITKRPCKSLKKFANYFLIYADFKISIGQGSCSTGAIFVKF